jgi:hypothetical protein
VGKSNRAMNYKNEVKVERNEWKASMPEKCMWCETKLPYIKLEIHEIERRSQAPKRWGSVANYLLLCRECHQGEFDAMPHMRQLAVKLLVDPNNFCLEEWINIKPRVPSYVTMADVIQELRGLIL